MNDFFLDTIHIHLNQPSIVLLTTNETEGSLKALYDPLMPLDDTERMDAHFWSEHAIIYRLGNASSVKMTTDRDHTWVYCSFAGDEDHFYLSPPMESSDRMPMTPLSITDISPPSSN